MDEQVEKVETPETEPVKSELDTFKQGVEEVSEPVEAKTEPVELKEGDAAPVEPKLDTPEVKAEPTPEDKQKQAIEAEIKERKLTGKSAERFRELAARPTKEDVEKQLAPLKEKAQYADQMNEVIQDSGANVEQIATAFKYLKAINSGNPALMKNALKSMTEEVQWLAKQLGEEVAAVDPVTDHADLNARIENGELTREAALEVARARAQAAKHEQFTQAQTTQAQAKIEYDTAMSQIEALNAKLKASDPHFAAKLAMLTPTLKLLRNTVPPRDWPAHIQEAYAQLPNPPAPPPVSAQPIRPTGHAGAMRSEPKNDLERFRFGVETSTPGALLDA